MIRYRSLIARLCLALVSLYSGAGASRIGPRSPSGLLGDTDPLTTDTLVSLNYRRHPEAPSRRLCTTDLGSFPRGFYGA